MSRISIEIKIAGNQFKKPDGQELFHDLVKQADVIVENFRSDVKYRLSVDYETVKGVGPTLFTRASQVWSRWAYATRPESTRLSRA